MARSSRIPLLAAVVILVASLLASRVSDGSPSICICSVKMRVVMPYRADAAPRNTRVRVLAGAGGTPPTLVLRLRGHEVATTATTITSLSKTLAWIEMSPAALLEPSALYEVATVDPTTRPSITVIGWFRTTDDVDRAAPRIDRAGTATPHKTPGPHDSCSSNGPRVTLEGLTAVDPARPLAQLAVLVWKGDGPTGSRIDETKPPDAIADLSLGEGGLVIGGPTACYPNPLPFDENAAVTLGVAVVDEAGNRSPLQRYRVDMGPAGP